VLLQQAEDFLTCEVILEFAHVRPLFGSGPVLIGLLLNDEMLYPNGIRIKGSTAKREPQKVSKKPEDQDLAVKTSLPASPNVKKIK
jgi:hypothetical protein